MKAQTILVRVDAESAIRLPDEVAEALGIREGDSCCFWRDDQNRLVLQPLRNELADEQDEWLDLVNERDEVMGRISRAEAWEKHLPVRGVNAFLVNSRGELWIPRRTLHKRMFPGCLDMSVGGHVESGEDYETAFRRETLEELNLNVEGVSWREIGAFSPYIHDLNIFMRVYEIYTDATPNFNSDDFSEAFWLTPRQLLERIVEGEPAKGDLAELVRLCYGEQLS